MADQTAPLNFVASAPTAIVSKLDYKHLKGPITADMFSKPELKNFQEFTTPVKPFVISNYSLNDLWAMIWGPKTFLEKYKAKRNETKLECPDWEFNADRSCATRLIKDIVIVDAPMPDTPTAFVEAHRVTAVQHDGKHELWFQHSAQTPEVISGTSFRVELLIHASAASATHGPITLTFTGSVMKCSAAFYAVKFIAVPRAMRETGDAMRVYCQVMTDHMKSLPPPPAAGAGGGGAAAGDGGAAAAAPSAAATPVAGTPAAGSAFGGDMSPPRGFGGGTTTTVIQQAPPPPLLVALVPAIGLFIAVFAMGGVVSRSYDVIGQLERSVQLQNRRWALVEQHVLPPFGTATVGGGIHLATLSDGGHSGAAVVPPQQARPAYSEFVGEEAGGAAATGSAEKGRAAPPSSSPSAAFVAQSQQRATRPDARGNSNSADTSSDAIPQWAHVVVGEVATLQSRLANAYWVIGAQFVVFVGFLVRRLSAGKQQN